MDTGERVALAGLEIGAIKLNPDNPFTWASGFRMPIYNDNRRFLFEDAHRELVTRGLYDLVFEQLDPDVIAGTSTAGIPWGTLLADRTGANFVYIRDKPKAHGLRNQIEGIDSESDLSDRRVLVIEDLISTGGSSARAVQAVRNAGGNCGYCFSIFDYGLDKAREEFGALSPECRTKSVLTYDILLDVAKRYGFIDKAQESMLGEWRLDPFGWGVRHGFAKEDK